MKKEDNMIDSLLREHAQRGNDADAEFLSDLEKRLDEETIPNSPSATAAGSSPSKFGLGIGLAAVLTVGAVGIYFADRAQKEHTSDVAMNDSRAQESQKSRMAPAAGSEKPSGELELTAPPSPLTQPPTFHNSSDKKNDQPPVTKSPAASSTTDDMERFRSTKGEPKQRKKAKDVRRDVKPSEEARSTPSVVPTSRPRVKPARGIELDKSVSKKSKPGLSGSITSDGLHNNRSLGRGRHPHIHPPRPVQETPSGNRYSALVDNKFLSPWKAPLSTFSVDVDTASYTNMRSLIQSGQRVAADAVRIEEMINYFNYNYPQPKGEHPFSVHVETATCPWNAKHKIVKVGLKGKDIIREKRPSANLVFLLDVSGSMNNRDKLPLLVDSMKILLKELNGDDTVSIVVYAGAKGLALPPTNVDADGLKTITTKLENLHAGGSTNGGAGITLAYNMAKKHFVKGGVNRVILGTDGDFNVGATSNDALVSMVERQAKAGVFLTVLGMGQGNLNDSMLEAITNKGNGNYAYIDSLKEGRKVFLDDMMGNLVPIAKDVKIQIEFNPAKVKSYRLIGYANRMLKAEDFKNKRIDAGEIGAGHTVTALYEIEPGNAAEATPVIDDLKYQKRKPAPKPTDREVVESPELMTVKLAYKQPTATKETDSTYFNTPVLDSDTTWQKSSADFKFASGVSLFGMLQRNSPHVGQGNYKLVKALAEQGRGKDAKGHRTEFSDLVRKASSK